MVFLLDPNKNTCSDFQLPFNPDLSPGKSSMLVLTPFKATPHYTRDDYFTRLNNGMNVWNEVITSH